MPLIESGTHSPTSHFQFEKRIIVSFFTAFAVNSEQNSQRTYSLTMIYLPRIYAECGLRTQYENKHLLKEKLPFDFEPFDFPSACVGYFAVSSQCRRISVDLFKQIRTSDARLSSIYGSAKVFFLILKLISRELKMSNSHILGIYKFVLTIYCIAWHTFFPFFFFNFHIIRIF